MQHSSRLALLIVSVLISMNVRGMGDEGFISLPFQSIAMQQDVQQEEQKKAAVNKKRPRSRENSNDMGHITRALFYCAEGWAGDLCWAYNKKTDELYKSLARPFSPESWASPCKSAHEAFEQLLDDLEKFNPEVRKKIVDTFAQELVLEKVKTPHDLLKWITKKQDCATEQRAKFLPSLPTAAIKIADPEINSAIKRPKPKRPRIESDVQQKLLFYRVERLTMLPVGSEVEEVTGNFFVIQQEKQPLTIVIQEEQPLTISDYPLVMHLEEELKVSAAGVPNPS